VILAINNYPEGQETPEIEFFRDLGVRVAPTPTMRRPEEAACFSARITEVRPANTENLLLFDVDCQFPNSMM